MKEIAFAGGGDGDGSDSQLTHSQTNMREHKCRPKEGKNVKKCSSNNKIK